VKRHDGFVRAICADPEDDTARLVYADWLDENGEPLRAEFIRLQCELDSTDPFAPGRRALCRREWDLIRKHGKQWIREDSIADVVDPESLWHHPPKTCFRRGFVDRAWFVSPDDFCRTAPVLFARAPVTGISLWSPYTVPQDRQQWFQNTGFAIAMRELGLQNYPVHEPCGTEFPEPDEFRRMADSPEFTRLRSFAMNALYTDRRHLRILAASPAAANLRELDLSGNMCLVGEAWAALVETPAFAGLRSLRLDDSHLRASGLGALVNSPHLGDLERLSLEADPNRSAVGPEGIRLICESRGLPKLRELNLHGQGGGSAGLRTLAAWPGLARLTRLDLSFFYAEGDAADVPPAWTAFVNSPHWGQLRELNLEGGDLENLEAILDGPNLATLRVLTFAYAFSRYDGHDEIPLQNEAAALLARCPHFADDLELQITAKGLSEAGRRLLRDRFRDGLILYPDDGARHRQPGDWGSGRLPWGAYSK
jgi:uncharacterized protein (TIGR02996 family)